MANFNGIESQTIAAIATAPGVGGIAVVRLSGSDCYTIASKVFTPQNKEKTLAGAKGYTAMFGRFHRDGVYFDEGVALVFRAPHSYTGEDVVELSCHGGTAVAKNLLDACIEAGAMPAGAGEYTRRAFLNGKLGLTQAEAVMDLIASTSRQGAALANTALSGALAKKISAQQTTLTALQAHLAAYVDFPEEDVPELATDTLCNTLREVNAALKELIDGYDAGAVLRAGVDTVILGRPNAGKSTLLNLLAGFERAIVTPVAGTTRDVIEQTVQLGDVQLNLFDTAGLHKTEDAIEAEGIRRSWQKLEEAGLIIAVFDGSTNWTEEDMALCEACDGRPALALLNKADLPPSFEEHHLSTYFSNVLSVSCKDPESYEKIVAQVAHILKTDAVDPNAACLSGQRQLAAAGRAHDALTQGIAAMQGGFGLDAVSVCIDDALDALFALTGENASDAVIEEIFERFCVGK